MSTSPTYVQFLSEDAVLVNHTDANGNTIRKKGDPLDHLPCETFDRPCRGCGTVTQFTVPGGFFHPRARSAASTVVDLLCDACRFQECQRMHSFRPFGVVPLPERGEFSMGEVTIAIQAQRQLFPATDVPLLPADVAALRVGLSAALQQHVNGAGWLTAGKNKDEDTDAARGAKNRASLAAQRGPIVSSATVNLPRGRGPLSLLIWTFLDPDNGNQTLLIDRAEVSGLFD